jgi:photosystem II stability/assembly factor-like uncharacterized protein
MAVAASDSKVIVTGALDGVYRSKDGGNSWEHISSPELKNIESIAVDPKDPNVIYAGTWHLAWKTSDGGANWQHINKGMIDDSDVFSIIVDSSNPSVVFASACSGIYKSTNGGDLFSKIQGIPFSARRTRVLKQDPSNENIVYAGTTEGLWKTSDLGKTWKRVTNPEVVVNDVMIDPRNSQRVLLATDRSGVLASDDGATTFTASNHGYTHRYVSSILANNKSGDVYVGVVNDKEQGGVFYSRDGGQHWMQKSSGLGGRDVFALEQTATGTLVAGTNNGMFLLERNASQWRPINVIVNEKTSVRTVKKGSKKSAVSTKSEVRSMLTAKVNEIEITPSRWFAATSAGLFMSTNEGKTWQGGPVMGNSDLVSVASNGDQIAVASRTMVLVSTNNGTGWQKAGLPSYMTGIRSVTITPDSQVMVASREGAYRGSAAGTAWEHMLNGIPDKNISSISYDEQSKRLMATSTATGVVFESRDGGQSWKRGPDTGYPLRRISVVKGRYMAATPFDGVIVENGSEGMSASADSGSSN